MVELLMLVLEPMLMLASQNKLPVGHAIMNFGKHK